jgi:osmotically-inducible protein OsmY
MAPPNRHETDGPQAGVVHALAAAAPSMGVRADKTVVAHARRTTSATGSAEPAHLRLASHARRRRQSIGVSGGVSLAGHDAVLSRKVNRRAEPETPRRTVSALPGIPPAVETADRPEKPSDADARSRIEQTLANMREVDGQRVRVQVDNHVVTLRGHVRCWSEHQIVERIAWSAPGVVHVQSHVVIAY